MTPPQRPNPFVGPRSFRTGEKLYGRDRELNELLDLLIAERIVLLYAPSGAGKSSLVQAALMPRLGEEGFRVLPVMRVSQEPPSSVANTPGFNRYVFSLLLSLEEALPAEEQLPLSELAGLTLTAYLDRHPAKDYEPKCDVLVFDQFEEILTVNQVDQEAKLEFFTQVGQALRDRSRWALFGMREDYIAGLDRYLRAIPTRLNNRFRLDMLGEAAARSAMQQPAQQVGVDFTEAAARKLANDLRKVRVQLADGTTEEQLGLYVEPVQLQVVCYRLWDRLSADAQQITEADAIAVGNVDSALSDYYAERVVSAAQATGISERAIRDWVEHQLITAQGIRGQVLQGPDQGLDGRAVQKLLDAYLVRAEKRRGATWLELAHDRLIAPVQANNAEWREANLSTLQRQAALWEKQNRPDGALLRDRALSDAEAWAEAHSAELTSVEQDYLAACRKARAAAQRERRNNRLIRGLAVAAFIGLILAGVAAVIAAQNAQRADAQSVIANQNAALAEQKRAEAEAAQKQADANAAEAKRQANIAAANEAQAKTERDNAIAQKKIADAQRLVAQAQSTLEQGNLQQLAMLLALAAQQNSPSAESEALLREGLPRLPFPVSQLPSLGTVHASVFSADGSRFATASDNGLHIWDANTGELLNNLIEDAGVRSIAFTPDGAWLISGEENQVRVWDVATGKGIAAVEQSNWVTSIAASPDGQWLAAADEDGNEVILQTSKIRAGEAPEYANFGGGYDNFSSGLRVNQIVFSPDSKFLATASDDNTVSLWNIATNGRASSVSHDGAALSVAFSPDGQSLASGGADKTARVWDVAANGALTEKLRLAHKDWVENVAFSPDGQTLTTASDDGTARLWNVANGQEEQRLRHEGAVRLVAFSTDGKWIATGSADYTARLWDASTGREVSQMSQPDALTALAYSPIGSRLVTGDASGLAQLWDMTPIEQLEAARIQQNDWVRDIAFSSDGATVATASDDFAAWLWKIANGRAEVVQELPGNPPNLIRAVALSPDGQWLAVAGDDSTVSLWPVASITDTQTSPLSVTHDSGVNTVAFSPDSQLLASGSADQTMRLWNVATGEELQKHEFSGAVTSVVYSSDSMRLAVSDENGYVTILDAATGEKVWTSPQSDYVVRAAAFSPDGQLVVSANDRYVTVWDVINNAELQQMAHDGEVRSVAFSPDGTLIATTSDDGTTRLWDAVTGDELARLFHVGNSLSLAFNSQGDRLAVADGNVAHIWDMNHTPLVRTDQLADHICSRLTRNLTQDEWRVYFGKEPFRQLCPNLP